MQPDKTTNDASCKSLRNISLIHLNVRSIKNRVNYVQAREMVVENNRDIFAVSETWLNSTVNNADVKTPAYSLFRLDRYYKRGGGVCVCAYVRETLKVTVPREVSHTSDKGFQQLCLRLQHKKLKSLLLCVVYRPPDCGITCLDNDLTSSLVEALFYDKDIFIIGDLNCDLLSEKPESKALNNFCTMFNLSQMISKPTRVTSDSSSLLDVILTTNPHQVIQTTIQVNSISDHFTISALLRLKAPKPHRSRILIRAYKNYGSEKFSEDI